MTDLQIKRENDGVDHLNVWSKAKTELGQMLSNFANIGFTHPEHGMFASMEAYWYWCATGKTNNEIRRMYGNSAKSFGKRLPVVEMEVEAFRDCIRSGLRAKVMQNERLRNMLAESTLPLKHYFVYGTKSDVIVGLEKHQWQMDYLERIRDELRAGRGLPPIAVNRDPHEVIPIPEATPVEPIKVFTEVRKSIQMTPEEKARAKAERIANQYKETRRAEDVFR